jgi:hypothetical protein
MESETERLVYEELEIYIQSIVKPFQLQTEQEFEEIITQLGIIAASTTNVKKELSDRWNIMSKLISLSYDKPKRTKEVV